MDSKNQSSSKTKRFRHWFTRKNKRADPFHSSKFSDGDKDDDNEDYEENVFCRPKEVSPGILTNDLRVFVGTWNVAGRSPRGSLAVDLDEWLNLKDAADIYVLGFQEIVPLKAKSVIGVEYSTEATNWNQLIGKTLNDKYGCPWLTPALNPLTNEYYQYVVPESESRVDQFATPSRSQSQARNKQRNPCSRYTLIASKKMVGVFISVWIRRSLLKRYKVSGVKVCSVGCGIMGYLGNKGSVSVSMSIEGTSFCFTAAHLASGEKKGDEGKRNYQVVEIFRRTSFPKLPQDGHNPYPVTIFGHDHIFWFGDLNYRLCLEDNSARQLIREQDWRALQNFDQLQKELEDGGVFEGWKEGDIEFAPTYKYSSSNCNRYSGGVPGRSGEKQRTPAWCDRILWYGKGVKQLSYFRSESKFSDHRPVSALFSTQIEVLKCANSKVVPFRPSIRTPTPSKTMQGKEKADEEATSTLSSLIVTNIEASPTYPRLHMP